MAAMRRWSILAAFLLIGDAAWPQTATFKIATWNIRSGMGISAFSGAAFDHTTLNCTDPAKPMNAWGVKFPQKFLVSEVKNDPAIVAFWTQEAWNCGNPKNLNAVLGFKSIADEAGGVTIAARYGIKGEWMKQRLGDPKHQRWLVGANVCLDAKCRTTLPMFSTHWGGTTSEDFVVQARAALEYLKPQPVPHVFGGDLNIFRIDKWNPERPCTLPDDEGRTAALELIREAGYTDAWASVNRGEGLTGMTSRKKCGQPEGGLYKRIDYLFSKGLTVVSAKRFAQPAPGADAPSDHVGLVVEYAKPKRSAPSPKPRAHGLKPRA